MTYLNLETTHQSLQSFKYGAIRPFQNLGIWIDELITKVSNAVSHFFANCARCLILPFRNLGIWVDELITKVSNAVSHFFSSCAKCIIQPFRNLGIWIDELITKVSNAVSHFFASCAQCLILPFRNLGIWIDELITKVSNAVSHFFASCAQCIIQPFRNLGIWVDELITKVSNAVSHFFSSCARCIIQPFRNLGIWVDELITKVSNAISHFFASCARCLILPFRNLGRWIQRQIDRITSYTSSFFAQTPPATKSSKIVRHRPGGRRRRTSEEMNATPLARLQRDWHKIEDKALAASIEQAERTEREEQAAEANRAEAAEKASKAEEKILSLQLDLLAGMTASGYLNPSIFSGSNSQKTDPERHTFPLRGKQRRNSELRFDRSTSRAFSQKSSAETAIVFCSQEHKTWYEENKKNMSPSVQLLHVTVNFSKTDDEKKEKKKIIEHIQLSYLVHLLASSPKDTFEISSLFRRLSPERQKELVQAHALEIVEWDGYTIPEGMWENPDILSHLTKALEELNLE